MNSDLVRGLFDYEPSSGHLIWRVAPGGRGRRGAVAGTLDSDGYVVVRYRGRGYKAHRLVWLHVYGVWPEGIVDHINHDRADNRVENLRVVDPLVNANHLSPSLRRGRSGERNVSWYSQYRKWKVMIQHNYRVYFVGYFDSVEQAKAAAALARQNLGMAT